MRHLLKFLAAASLAVIMTACGGDDTTGDSLTQGAADGINKVTTAASGTLEAARDQFVDAMKSKVSGIEEQLADYDGKLSSLNPMAKKAAEKPLTIAHEKVDAVKDQISTLTDAPIEKWADHKPAVEKAFTELQDSFSKVTGLF